MGSGSRRFLGLPGWLIVSVVHENIAVIPFRMGLLFPLIPKQYAYKIAEETRESLKDYYKKRIQDEKENPKLSKVPKPGEESKKSKGIKKNIVKNELTVDDYKHSLFNKTVVRKTQYTIRIVKHTIFTQCQNKVALNNDCGEHKRYIIKDSDSLRQLRLRVLGIILSWLLLFDRLSVWPESSIFYFPFLFFPFL